MHGREAAEKKGTAQAGSELAALGIA